MEQFSAEPHVLVTSTSGHNMAEEVLKTLDIKRRVRLRLPHFSVLPKVIPGTQWLTVLPVQIAEGFCRIPLAGPLKMLELPFKVPSFHVNLHLHVRSDESTALKWFCAQIMTSLSDLQA